MGYGGGGWGDSSSVFLEYYWQNKGLLGSSSSPLH